MTGAISFSKNDGTKTNNVIRAVRRDKQVDNFVPCEISGLSLSIQRAGISFAGTKINIVRDYRRRYAPMAIAEINRHLIARATGWSTAANRNIGIAISVEVRGRNPGTSGFNGAQKTERAVSISLQNLDPAAGTACD